MLIDPKQKKRIEGGDVNVVRELLGITSPDFAFLAGSSPPHDWRVTGPESHNPMNSPTLSILMRLLMAYPDVNPLPAVIPSDQLLEEMNRTGLIKVSGRRLGLLSGVSSWSGTQWAKHHAEPKPQVVHLHQALHRLLLKYGAEGFQDFLDIVEAEYEARGLGSLEDLIGTGNTGWHRTKVRQEDRD